MGICDKSTDLDRTIYIGAVLYGSTVLVSGVGKLCAADNILRWILDGYWHEKINIPTAHQRHLAA